METTDYNLNELAGKAANSILSSLNFSYTLRTEDTEDGVNVLIDSKDSAYLIGEDGDRLDDLQYLINRLAQAEQDNAPRIRVDCNLYRAKNEAKLMRRARARAERVLQTGNPLQMEKLNAYQRRLVHKELAGIPGIATESEDTESRFKRITISRLPEA